MNRPAQASILLLVGAAVLRASLTDLYLRYVKQGLRPFLVVAGALLIAAGAMTIWHEFREQKKADHDHPLRAAWLLMLPVLALLMVVPPALGAYAAGRSGTSLPPVSDFGPMPAGDPAKISVIEYASRATHDGGRSLGDRRVRLTGFVMNGGDGRAYLVRMILTCCAADARPVKVGLTGQVPSDLRPDTWLEVTGRYTAGSAKDAVNGEAIPYLDVLELQPVRAPKQEYES